MRRLMASLVVLVMLGAGIAAAQALAATRSVKIGDNFFIRPGHHTITVGRGATLRFRWTGSSTHDVHAIRGPVHFRSRFMSSGTFAKKLRRRGTYVIRCDLHPRRMRLTVRVR